MPDFLFSLFFSLFPKYFLIVIIHKTLLRTVRWDSDFKAALVLLGCVKMREKGDLPGRG